MVGLSKMLLNSLMTATVIAARLLANGEAELYGTSCIDQDPRGDQK
jgi:hypothetical protein